MQQATRIDQRTHLIPTERTLLLLALAASAFVGLFQFFLPQLLAQVTGYSGNDLYIYRLSGAATFGYAVALALALRQNSWSAIRIVIIAFFTFGIASIYACGTDIISSLPKPTGYVVYVVLALTVIFVAITGTLLYTHRNESKGSPDIANWVVWFIVIATVLAMTFGLLPLLLPDILTRLFALNGKDVFILRQAGAATLGYAVMGLFQLRSRNWDEIRWPVAMAGTFNGLSFIASIFALMSGGPLLLAILVTPASLAVTIASIVAFIRQGK